MLFLDVDECLVLGICSQICQNFPGGYQCSCMNGYELRDKRFCDVPGGKKSFLVLQALT